MTIADRILALFVSDDTVLRPSEIIRRTSANEDSIYKTLGRLVKRGRLFNIAHSQYARVATAVPVTSVKVQRIVELDRRVTELEQIVTRLLVIE